MEAGQATGIDSLASLEERITRAVQMITELRAQNATMALRVSSMEEELKQARTASQGVESKTADLLRERSELEQHSKRLAQEVEEMRGERKQVRSRIEKLLGQLDLLSAS